MSRSSWISLPHNPTPLSCHKASGLRSLHHTANSHWLSTLHIVTYMFQCYSFNSSLPSPGLFQTPWSYHFLLFIGSCRLQHRPSVQTTNLATSQAWAKDDLRPFLHWQTTGPGPKARAQETGSCEYGPGPLGSISSLSLQAHFLPPCQMHPLHVICQQAIQQLFNFP